MGIAISRILPNGFEAKYARPLAIPSLRLDNGHVELMVALYKDAAARFSGAEPASFDRITLDLTEEERADIAAILYQAIAREGRYPDGVAVDPDPEKENA